MIWKDEALRAFETWSIIYQRQPKTKDDEEDGDQASVEFLKNQMQELYLMNVVENDYIGGDLKKVITEFIN